MIASTNRIYSTINIKCTESELENILHYLDTEIKSQSKRTPVPYDIIELLDAFRRKAQRGKLVDGHVYLPFVTAFIITHSVRQHVFRNPATESDEASALHDFFSSIDGIMSETFEEAEYKRLTQGKHQETPLIYHEYLTHLYQCHSPRLNGADKKDLLAHLFDQLTIKNAHMQTTIKYWSGCVTICPYDTFNALCEVWKERNEEEEIYFDEILVDDDFISRGYTWRLFKPDSDTIHRCAQCVLGPQEQCIMHHPWHPVPRA